MKIAGLDIGTTGCKLTVFDSQGNCLDKAYRDYPVRRSFGEHETDPSAILEAVFAVIRSVTEAHPDIEGLGVTSFGETFVLADESGRPLHMAMLYTDPRGLTECEELVQKIGRKKLLSLTGVNPHQMYSISKIMWLKRSRPHLYEKARHIFLMEDLVIYALTKKARIDYSLAARTMAFDIHRLAWSREIFDAAGIDRSLMSECVPSGTVAGTVTKEAMASTGLRAGTRVACIGHDQVAAAVGAGVFDSSAAVDGAGTVECITPVMDGIPDQEAAARGNFAVVPYVIPGKYVCYAFSYMGGALIQWCIETLAKKEREFAKEAGISVNEYLEKCTASPTGLLVLPHLAGAATPYMDTGSKGVIVGLTADTTVGELYRACMEGVVYEMMVNMEYLQQAGIQIQKLHATGGGARSGEWLQMKADMLNLPVTALVTEDAGTVGSAMLTGIAAGCFADLKDAAGHMVQMRETYYPRADMHDKYQEIYMRYRNLYSAVRPLMGDTQKTAESSGDFGVN